MSQDSLVSLVHEEVLTATIPTDKSRYDRSLFDFVRRLKAMPHLADADPTDLDPLVCGWHRLASEVVPGLEVTRVTADFLMGWRRAKFPDGAGPLSEAMKAAKGGIPPKLPPGCQEDGIGLLAALCRELQRNAGAGLFYLAWRSAGEELGVSYTTAGRWLLCLQMKKVIREYEKGSLGKRRASRYRYLLPLSGK